MTIKKVDWKAFKGVVENGLAKAQLSKADVDGSIGQVREVIDEVLEIYVEKRYRNRFRIETKYRLGSYEATLYHELEKLCSWSGQLA